MTTKPAEKKIIAPEKMKHSTLLGFSVLGSCCVLWFCVSIALGVGFGIAVSDSDTSCGKMEIFAWDPQTIPTDLETMLRADLRTTEPDGCNQCEFGKVALWISPGDLCLMQAQNRLPGTPTFQHCDGEYKDDFQIPHHVKACLLFQDVDFLWETRHCHYPANGTVFTNIMKEGLLVCAASNWIAADVSGYTCGGTFYPNNVNPGYDITGSDLQMIQMAQANPTFCNCNLNGEWVDSGNQCEEQMGALICGGYGGGDGNEAHLGWLLSFLELAQDKGGTCVNDGADIACLGQYDLSQGAFGTAISQVKNMMKINTDLLYNTYQNSNQQGAAPPLYHGNLLMCIANMLESYQPVCEYCMNNFMPITCLEKMKESPKCPFN